MRVALEVYAGLEYAGFQRKLKLGDSLGWPCAAFRSSWRTERLLRGDANSANHLAHFGKCKLSSPSPTGTIPHCR
jgi:hypothetical protein